jgi:Ran GTPase-activating protein (RanGAP) involved in mRNA processing and transport
MPEHVEPFKVKEMFDNLHPLMVDQQKRALDKLVDSRYNQIHEDAFNKICGLEENGKRSWSSRARDVIGGLWFERKRFKEIMKTQDFEYTKLLRETEELRAEIVALKKMKREYGRA